MNNICKQKIRLLCEGANVARGINKGRKAGAGPAGGNFFELKDSIINLPLWPKFAQASNLKLMKKANEWLVIQNDEIFCKLIKIPPPKFYSLRSSDGILMKEIARLHGKDCLATTIYQRCIYWKNNLQCKFCGIEISYREGDTILQKSPNQLLEVLIKGVEEKRVKHITLTTGTLETREQEVKLYTKILEKLKSYMNIPIHIQLEPPSHNDLDKLNSKGADTIGIHIESFDEKVRHNICPGKYQAADLTMYKKAWRDAVEIFGEAQVSSYVIIGLGEDKESIIKGSEWLIRMGIIPFIIPIKPIIGTLFENHSPPSYEITLEICREIADLFRDYGLNPFKNKAGCVRCGACSPIKEAITYLT